MNPFFTVYIPFHTYGYAIKAKDALRSLDAQSFTSFETILIANGTSFPSWMNEGDIYKSTGVFGRKIIGGEYHTLGAAANAAIALAKGNWIVRLDADVYLESNALWHFVNTIEQHSDKPIIGVQGHWDEDNPDKVMGAGLAIQTSLLQEVCGYNEEEPINDGESIVRKISNEVFGTATSKWGLVRTEKPIYNYERHEGSMSCPG